MRRDADGWEIGSWIRPYLRDQDLRRPTIYSRDGAKELYLLGERGAFPRSISMLNLESDGLIKVVDVRASILPTM